MNDQGSPGGERLEAAMRRAMTERGLSANRTAKLAGFSGPTIFYSWWRGRSIPRRPTLARVASVLSIPVEELADAAGIEPGPPGSGPDLLAITDDLGRLAVQVKQLRSEMTDLTRLLEAEQEARVAWEQAFAEGLSDLRSAGTRSTPRAEPSPGPRAGSAR